MHDATLLPILYAMTCALFFGCQSVLTMRSLTYMDSQTCSMISMGTCVFIFWLLAPFLLEKEYFLNRGMWVFFANGFIHPLFSMTLSYKANKIMGATVSTTIASLAPLFAALGSLLFLKEHLTFPLLLGTLGTVAGVMVLSWNHRGPSRWALTALFYPIGASVIRGANHVIGKFGLEMLPSPYFAGLVSFTVSFAGAFFIYRVRSGSMAVRVPLAGLRLSALAGLCISVGVLCMYAALNSGYVVVVSPIISTFPLFTFLISLLFRQEVLSKRILLGVLLVVCGVIVIGLL